MARSTRRIAVTGAAGSNYWNVEDMPWADIERRTGVQFSEEHRREIHILARDAIAEYDVAVGSPAVGDVKALRDEILLHAKAIVEIARKHRTPEGLPLVKGGQLVDETAEAAFLGVALTSHDPDFDLTEHLLAAAAACEDLVTGLSNPQTEELATARAGNVILLAHFIANAINRAPKTEASRIPGYQGVPNAFEYYRWGLHLSPQFGHLGVAP